MEAAAAETLAEVGTFRNQGRMVDFVLQANVAGLTQADSLVQPEADGNCLNWVVGHLVCIYNQCLRLLGQERVMGEAELKRYERGSPPIHGASEALELGDLLAAWNETVRRVDAGLASLTAERLNEPAPSPTGNPDETVRSLMATILFHQAYHAGQTGLLRRIAGKPGAIA